MVYDGSALHRKKYLFPILNGGFNGITDLHLEWGNAILDEIDKQLLEVETIFPWKQELVLSEITVSSQGKSRVVHF